MIWNSGCENNFLDILLEQWYVFKLNKKTNSDLSKVFSEPSYLQTDDNSGGFR